MTLALWTVLVASSAGAQAPAPAVPLPNATVSDSLRRATVVWGNVTPLIQKGRVTDVAFPYNGLNIVMPAEMVWNLDASDKQLIAIASKPIAGTAEAGEEMGRRGAGLLHAPIAVALGAGRTYVLEESGRLFVIRSAWIDSLELGTAPDPGRDIAVSPTGMVYVLMGREVRVYADPPSPKPLWTIALPAKLLPAVAIAVNARGEVFVGGHGAEALDVFELDGRGAYKRTRGQTATQLQIGEVGGLAVSPALLVPLAGREGWVGPDRFLIVADSKRPGFIALEASSLARVGRIEIATEVPGAVPGRTDVGNRAQIAFADMVSGRSYALPARLFATLVSSAKFRWRTLEPDSTAVGSHGQ